MGAAGRAAQLGRGKGSTFALEIQLFGNRPHVHHAVNIALFAACAALLCLLVLALLVPPGAPRPEPAPAPARVVALVTALLFAAHPIHTEVVANLKSRDELLCLFFILLMLHLLIALAGLFAGLATPATPAPSDVRAEPGTSFRELRT